jgi:hypothetical protein
MPGDVPDGRSRPRWRGRPLLLTGTAVATLTVGAGLALAATSGPSRFPLLSAGLPGSLSAATSASAPPSACPGCVRVVIPGRAGVLCRRPGWPGVLHGTLVLPRPGGGTLTVEIQNGRVIAVSRSSITLKSNDGFTRTYTVTSSTLVAAQRDGIGSVKVGDQAWVAATASGGTVTATRIGDLSQLRFGPGNLPGAAGQRLVPPSRGGSAASYSGGLAGG